ncbi:MAG: hypothetical protein LBF58_08565 [Deltaproteobacteria bacterium]|jgi:thymidylate synthase|nr:hypothetical protein [Deltaproteobacteria bacterium]
MTVSPTAGLNMLLTLAIEAKNIIVINRGGTVGICSLWTPVEYLRRRIAEKRPGLLADGSPIALIGGLYGGGLNVMLRNVHHNPQIDTLILCGKDFSGASDHLKLFLGGKVTMTGKKQPYVYDDGRAEELEKLVIEGPGASYTMDSLLLPDMLLTTPRALDLTGPITDAVIDEISSFLASYRPAGPPPGRPAAIPLPKPRVDLFPSDPFGHQIQEPTIVEAWAEILTRLHRFGRPVRLRNGKERLELMNFKAVIENPLLITADDRALLNVSETKLSEYQAQLLSPDLDHGMPYTYGNRMRRYFNVDLLDWAARDLARAGDSRHAYLALWDNNADPEGHDSPCLVSIFFRKTDDKVHLTAQFRSHNGARAWPVNCVGLQGLLKSVCEAANSDPARTETHSLTPGRLTVISLSLSLDPADLPQVLSVIEAREARAFKMKTDPNGFFRIAVNHDEGLIVVFHHAPDGELLFEYSGKTPSEIGWRLAKNKAFSDPYHALYLGGQLERAWRSLRLGTEYSQDKSLPD